MGAVPLCSGSSSTPQTSYLKNVYHHVGPRCVLARRSFMVLLSYLRNNSQNHQEPLLPLAQTQPLYRSYRAGVWRLSLCLCPYRKENQHRKYWEKLQHRTSLDHLFVQHKCTLYSHGSIQWELFVSPICHCTGTFHSTRPTTLGEPPPVSLLSWSREGLVIGRSPQIRHHPRV